MTLYGEGSYASSTNQESNLSQSSNGAENSFLRRGGIFRRSEGSGMLIGDPLSGGSSASSTNRRPITELWGADSNASSTIKASELPQSFEERKTHSSEWEGTPPLRKERQAQPWALESGELIPQNERELPAQQGAACS